MKLFQNFVVGILFAGSLALVGYFTVLSDSGPFARQGQQLVLYFDHAEGVKAGTRVTVLGVPAGTVIDIELVSIDDRGQPVPDDSELRSRQIVGITVELKKPVVFYSNYRISLKNESILSGKVVAIDPGTARVTTGLAPERLQVVWVDPREAAQSGKSASQYSLEKLMADRESAKTMTALQGQNAGDPVAGLAEMISENRDDVRRTIQNVAEITDKINNGRGTIGLLINDNQLHENATTLVTDARLVVREMRESLEDTREQAPVTSFLRAALTAF
ncbi:MlaD family protein [Leptonema illini]|uniref:Mammalian cell entry related domain protein n=1 Tax=Leptonema illini DSM 21528 TaxID=929563 RepID=H2CAK7_9LEPT|nr:MlaD family protein [Leptonema illini]EHQ08385.1 Mammalian cell entry related domain protein [Leptonema illini DSM 21528]